MPAAKSLQAVGFKNLQSERKEKNLHLLAWSLVATNCSEYSGTGPEVRGEEVTKLPGDAVMWMGLLATCAFLSDHICSWQMPHRCCRCSSILPEAQWPPCQCSHFSWPKLWMLLGVYDYYLIPMNVFFSLVAWSVGKSCDQCLTPREDSHR